MGEGHEVSFKDGYWFAYISTTTVGLGDFILLPDVLLPVDILVWPLSFLVGFVFFAAFIGKISEASRGPFQNRGTGLAERLKRGRPAEMSGETLENRDSASLAGHGEELQAGDHLAEDLDLVVSGRSSETPGQARQDGDDEAGISVRMEPIARGTVH